MTSSVTGGWPLALVILLLVAMDSTATGRTGMIHVEEWDEFFLEKIPPEIPKVLVKGKILDQNRYKPIRQTYKNEARFMTLYDERNKIPVFSAYKYTGHIEGRSNTNWKPEPQLDAKQQATIKDWPKGISHDKGHLYPCFHADSKDDQKSTFMLTNCVPQVASFNRGRWCQMENYVKVLMDKYCSNQNNHLEAFVIVGAVPSDKYMGTVNIPKTLWAAFCCYSKERGRWLASAHYGANEEVPKDDRKKMKPITLAELKTDLNIRPFPNENCLAHSVMPDDPIPEEGENCDFPNNRKKQRIRFPDSG